MKRIVLTLLLVETIISYKALAQAGIPVSKEAWGKAPDYVETRLLSAPGFERSNSRQEGDFFFVSYQSTDGAHEVLTYAYKLDSLVGVTRYVPNYYQKDVAPEPSWESIGINEWRILLENVWIKRYYDGRFIKDLFRRIE
jgi:hypothetical protein